ncbi:T9SS type A sorting domain-containing protein [bacterium]|nr:T9SS type A sorting domain-containing protein [bacterium]
MNRCGFLLTLCAVMLLAAGATYADTCVLNGLPSDTPVPDGSTPYQSPPVSPTIDEEFIDFDDLDAPGLFNDQIPLTDEYLDQGVLFEGQGEVLNESGNFGISNYSSPNFLAFNTGAGVYPPETMLFDPPILSLTILAGHSSSGTITATAYDSNGSLVGSYSITGLSSLQTLNVEGDDIAEVVLDFTGSICCFDDLTFEQDLEPDPIELTLTPTSITIPPSGGNVVYDVSLVSLIGASYPNVAYWTEVTLPNSQVFGPLTQMHFDLIPFMNVSQTGMTQNIPSLAPQGAYTFTARVGYMNGPYLEDSFIFTKTGVAADGVDNWNGSEFQIAADESSVESLPSGFALLPSYPNPFNAQTSIRVTLPETSELTISVYNVAGQQVAELVNGPINAGSHEYSFDATHLASGLYFVQAAVPGRMMQTQKVLLVQ